MRTHVLQVGRVNAFFMSNHLCFFHFRDERFAEPVLPMVRVVDYHVRAFLPRFNVSDVRWTNVVVPLVAHFVFGVSPRSAPSRVYATLQANLSGASINPSKSIRSSIAG